MFYTGLFWLCLLGMSAVTYSSLGGVKGFKELVFGSVGRRDDEEEGLASGHGLASVKRKLQIKYLIVYFFMVAGDWLQGPYVYALYQSYGWDRNMIAILFVLGFGSSMFIGTFIGSLADKYGRKRFVFLYAILYILSCLSKHNKTFYFLAVGRLLGGAATSLLMSTFESWLVCEYHNIESEAGNKGSEDSFSLSKTFSLAALTNSIAAIICGIIAEYSVSMFPYPSDPETSSSPWVIGGYTAPFDLAIIVLLIGSYFTFALWSENYGGPSADSASFNEFFSVLKHVLQEAKLRYLGTIQACFEGAMYSFIFMWTPALMSSSDEPAPLGTIFSTFMICAMAGSQSFAILIRFGYSEEKILTGTLVVSCASLLFGSIDDVFGTNLMYIGFLIFEFCVGIYFPCMGTLKGKIVPDDTRSTVYNIFRIPLNAIVLVVLLNNFSVKLTFILCSSLLGIAALVQGVAMPRT